MGLRITGLALAGIAAVGCWSMTTKKAETSNLEGTNLEGKSSPTSSTAALPTPKPVTSPPKTVATSGSFMSNLPTGFEQPTDDAGRLLLKEYGAVFLTRNGAVPPKKVVFRDESDLLAYQNTVTFTKATVGGKPIELQARAMDALQAAVADAKAERLSITPRGSGPARRSFRETVINWNGKVSAGFRRWVPSRVSAAEAKRISALTPYEQVPEILRLESQGIYFSLNFDKSIIFSVAPPGGSQHMYGLALDVTEFASSRQRAILAKHGWFQTVASDLPHFTYIGVTEDELASLGLKKVGSGQVFWVPDI